MVYPAFTDPEWATWITEYGISDTIGDVSGLYFGYTDDPTFAAFRQTIPWSPKFPNVNFNAQGSILATIASFPGELLGSLTYFDDYSTLASAEVPLGTSLTFYEGDPAGWYNFSTLYRDVDGVPTPFEEFRPLLGDGPDQYVLDDEGVVDLVVFSFYTGSIYPDPGAPSFPVLIHINVVPEPSALLLGVGLAGFLLSRRRC